MNRPLIVTAEEHAIGTYFENGHSLHHCVAEPELKLCLENGADKYVDECFHTLFVAPYLEKQPQDPVCCGSQSPIFIKTHPDASQKATKAIKTLSPKQLLPLRSQSLPDCRPRLNCRQISAPQRPCRPHSSLLEPCLRQPRYDSTLSPTEPRNDSGFICASGSITTAESETTSCGGQTCTDIQDQKQRTLVCDISNSDLSSCVISGPRYPWRTVRHLFSKMKTRKSTTPSGISSADSWAMTEQTEQHTPQSFFEYDDAEDGDAAVGERAAIYFRRLANATTVLGQVKQHTGADG